MIKLTGTTRVGAAWVAGVALLAGAATASDATLQGPYAAEYSRAYEAITQERVVEGATELLQFFRELPPEDVGLTETTLGHAHLLWFATTRLMWRGERNSFYFDTLQAGHIRQARRVQDYPTDALLRHSLELKHLDFGAHMIAPGRLWRVAKGEHVAVSATSLVALGHLRHYRGEFLDLQEPRTLVIQHPELELSRYLVEIPVLEAVRLARNPEQSLEFRDESPGTLVRARRRKNGSQPGQHRSLFQFSVFGEQGGASSYEVSPGLRAASRVLPSMHTRAINDEVIAGWSEHLEDGEADAAVRYFLTGLLAAACTDAAERDAARPGLETVAALPPTTADVLRAQIVLTHFAREDHRVDEMYERVHRLTALRLPPSAPDFNAYAEVIEATQMASDYFMRYGHIGHAVRTHEACGAMFPGTPHAHAELRRAELLTQEGARISIGRASALVDTYMHNSQQLVRGSPAESQAWRDKAQSMLEDIMEHTPHPGIRDAMAARLDRLDEQMPSPPPRPPRNSALSAWNSTFILERNAGSPGDFQPGGSSFLNQIRQNTGN